MSLVAGAVVETLPGQAPAVAARLAGEPGLSLAGGDGRRLIAVVCEAADGEALEALSQRLLAEHPEVLGVYPTFVGDDEA